MLSLISEIISLYKLSSISNSSNFSLILPFLSTVTAISSFDVFSITLFMRFFNSFTSFLTASTPSSSFFKESLELLSFDSSIIFLLCSKIFFSIKDNSFLFSSNFLFSDSNCSFSMIFFISSIDFLKAFSSSISLFSFLPSFAASLSVFSTAAVTSINFPENNPKNPFFFIFLWLIIIASFPISYLILANASLISLTTYFLIIILDAYNPFTVNLNIIWYFIQ